MGETECTCIECRDPVCAVGYKLTTVKEGGDTQCCPTKECVRPEAPCPPVVQPQCLKDQVLKKIVSENGCVSYACECNSYCAEAEKDGELYPGEQWSLDTSGCCPEYVKICNTDTCPDQTCPQFYLNT